MINLVIFGAPGSGKGTQSQKIADRYGLRHISTGEVLREHISRGTELGKIADSYISKGNLIPDDLMVNVLADILDKKPEETRHGVIFDGFPRTIPQAIALNDMLEKRGTKIHSVLGLEVPEEELMDRIIKRGQETGRADDNKETVKQRLQVYHNQTSPLKKYYTDQNKFQYINGSGSVDEIFSHITRHLDELKKTEEQPD